MAGFTPKLIIFDLNETLIEENTWKDLNMAMGVTQEEDKLLLKWYEEGIISYAEGQKFLSSIYRERGRATVANVAAAVGKYKYHSGAREIVGYLQSRGFRLAIVTGAIDVVVQKVAQELGIGLFAAHNHLVFDEQGRFERINCVGDDSDFKLAQLLKYTNELGILVDEVMCVGDGYNDEKMFAACGHGVTFTGSKIKRSAWKVIAKLADLREFL